MPTKKTPNNNNNKKNPKTKQTEPRKERAALNCITIENEMHKFTKTSKKTFMIRISWD